MPQDCAYDEFQPAVPIDPASQKRTRPVDSRGDQLDVARRAGAIGDFEAAEAV